MVESPTEAATPRPLVDLKNTAGAEKKDHLTMLLLELFVKTRAHHIPDPLIDPIEAVFYSGTDHRILDPVEAFRWCAPHSWATPITDVSSVLARKDGPHSGPTKTQ